MSTIEFIRRPSSMMRAFLQTEAAGGIILMAAAAAAMIVANSPFSLDYRETLHLKLGGLSLLHWINDGLMALFFLIVGLEIKREVVDGQLSRWSDRILPGVAAAAGVALPALIYVSLNQSDPAGLRGWAIPAATDIAFALGILALLGSRVPTSLKIFLTAVAIIDDLIAVLIIAIFYTAQLYLLPLAGAGIGLVVLALCNRRGVTALWPYLLVGIAVWLCVLQSGIHATLAGVAVALTIPMTRTPAAPDDTQSPLARLEHGLHPWVAYAIVPIFGFANAGVPLAGFTVADALSPVPLGVALGLFIGKQVGIFSTVWLLARLGWSQRPRDANWYQVYGIALLCGIGFTMSLFIGSLAFGEGSHQNDAAKLGVLAGSIASAIIGFIVLRIAPSTTAFRP
ncbi:Na+/H+ antiporter NhaA type [Sphingobium indicum BiD32]|uniref:Na(+)/H(+) antiporter NhaA n=1 Tax=Sphingobium indicum BiD32 TaxID=1301087 RepID=N1MXD9_9SPHN|nr:Na+/H+ antiporter NhaA [Sphingobium indicum]CCW19953.1 Na+/H+ antiporter NhaA type [Sphingobium indicum BiD32]